jgi:tight adherence protein C
MIIFFIVGLVLFGLATSLVLSAIGGGRTRLVENLATIDSYGFSRVAAVAQPKSKVRIAADDLATLVGTAVAGRFSRLDETAIRNMLMAAGIYGFGARRFTGYRVLAAAGAVLTELWLGITGGYAPAFVMIGAVVALVVGWTVPLSIVRRRGERRLAKIDYSLPELIDLLIVTVEAGLSFNASLVVASERLEGPLGQELRLALQEQAMGLATSEALQHMLERADTPAMRSFVRSMLQGETLGVSIGRILRELAQEMRKRRRASAEERAQKAPIKILFPLIFMIFPAMFVILLGPAVASLIKAVGG